MKRGKKYSVSLNTGWQFNVAVYGNPKEFKSFCEHCKVCKVKCNQYIFLNCINTREEQLIAFRNMKEAKEFMQEMLFF